MAEKFDDLTVHERAVWLPHKNGWSYKNITKVLNKTEEQIQTTTLSVANYLGGILMEFRTDKRNTIRRKRINQ